jgi:hypothetical protein
MAGVRLILFCGLVLAASILFIGFTVWRALEEPYH